MSEPTEPNPPPSPNLSLLELIRLDDETAAPQNTLAPCPQNRKRWRSCATWETSVLSSGFSTDEHDTKEEAEAVCRMLHKQGFGGNGVQFPLKTWVEWIEAIHPDNASTAPCPIKDEGEETKELGKTDASTVPVRPTGQKERQHILASAGYWFESSRNAKNVWDALNGMENAYNHVENALAACNDFIEAYFVRGVLRFPDGKTYREHAKELLSRTGNSPGVSVSSKDSPKASPVTTGKGPMEALLSDFYDAWCDHADSSVKLRTSRKLETLANKIALLRGAPSEGRGTDEQGGLPVTPNSSSPAPTDKERLDWWFGNLGVQLWKEPSGWWKCCIPDVPKCRTYRGLTPREAIDAAMSPALPLPLSEETKKDL